MLKKYRIDYIAIGIIVLYTVFFMQQQMIDKSLRLAPLANGWVSQYAGLHLSDDNILKKYRSTVSSDIGVGRFRPASFIYTSFAYGVTPIIHNRLNDDDQRSYVGLVTGDLRITAIIFLCSISISLTCILMTLYRYTNKLISLTIPIVYISITPSLTENLLQNYIDSQDIQLFVSLSFWLSALFLGIVTQNKIAYNISIIISCFFLLISYLTKETAIVLPACTVLLFLIMYTYNILQKNEADRITGKYVLLNCNLVISIIMSSYVYAKAFYGNKQYGTNFDITNVSQIVENNSLLWRAFSLYTINTVPVIIFLFFTLFLILFNIKKKINNIPVIDHLCVYVVLLLSGLLMYGIMLPWQFPLIKYLFVPSCFIALSVYYAIFLVSELFIPKYKNIIYIGTMAALMVYFNSFYANAKSFNSSSCESSSYGAIIIDNLVSNIDNATQALGKKSVRIFVEYGTEAEWKKYVPWGLLHLQRILSVEKKYNIVDAQNAPVLNLSMPRDDMTSFRYNKKNINIFITNRREELSRFHFDVVYKGYMKNAIPQEKISYTLSDSSVADYQLTGESIHYVSPNNFSEFILYAYCPAVQ